MTFISSITTNQGIIMAADSKELLSGAYITWNDFSDVLKSKSLDEKDENLTISPFEIREKFEASTKISRGRIRSIDNAIKIFKIGSHTALLISGVANPGGAEFSEIVKKIQSEANKNSSYNEIEKITFDNIKPLMDALADKHEDTSELIFCGYDSDLDRFRTHIFFFRGKRTPDGQEDFVKDKNGKYITNYFYDHREASQHINIGGWKAHAEVMVSNLNQLQLEINMANGFEFSKTLMDVNVAAEKLSHSVAGIGGRIYYAAITKNGFTWISSLSDIMNRC